MHLDEYIDLVSTIKNRLFRLACWMLKNNEDAEDLVQDVFVKLWQNKSQLEKYRNIEAVSYQMTKNMCLNKIKADRSLMYTLDPEKLNGHDMGMGIESKMEHQEKLHWVKKAIDKLPDQQKVVLQMRGVEGMETREIADLLGETENNIRVILSRARKYVRAECQKFYSHEN